MKGNSPNFTSFVLTFEIFPVLLKTTDSCLRNGFSVAQPKIHEGFFSGYSNFPANRCQARSVLHCVLGFYKICFFFMRDFLPLKIASLREKTPRQSEEIKVTK